MKLLSVFLIALLTVLSFSCLTTASEEPVMSVPVLERTAAEIPSNEPAVTSASVTENDHTDNTKDTVNGTSDSAQPVDQELPEAKSPLSEHDFRRVITEMMPWNMIAIKDGAVPLAITHDLDKNGYEDALVVAVEGDESTEVSLADLSKSARLFQSGRKYSNFLLLIFYQYSNEIVLRYTVPVSRQLVFNGVEPIEIKKGSDFPYALLFSFRTRSGIEQELIILSGYGITRFSIMENLSEITLIEDIDEDGYQDIIVHEQGFEEGTGFETFLSWYKWNSREYFEYKNTNIVRNLKQFYLVCAEYLRAGEKEKFLNYALDSQALSELKKQGLTNIEILGKIFKPAEGSVDDDFFETGAFSSVVFPEIMETPFSYANRMDLRHQVSVRFGRQGGDSRIYLTELKMKKNPFQNKQFCFSIDK